MKRLVALLVLAAAVHLPGQATYYVSNAGSDSNSGTSPSASWKTIGRVNKALPTLAPGSQILLNRGDVWRDDYIRCQNLVNATPATTLLSNPPACSGVAGRSILIGAYGKADALPLIDGADPLTGTWTQLPGHPTVWQLKGVTTPPIKIYVDGATSPTMELTPVPNAVGPFVPGRTYNQLDGVTADTSYYVNGVPGLASSGGKNVKDYFTWRNVTNHAPTCTATQTFSPSNSGLQNVESIGNGSWQVYLSVDGKCGGHGYADTTAFTSTGGGPKCSLTGTMTAINGTPSTLQFSSNSGCTSQPTIVLTAPTGEGGAFIFRQDHGSWYWDGSTITVQLQDGSNPNLHTMEATHRPYGILLESSNYVDVDHIAVEHTAFSGILSTVYSSDQKGGNYFTGEYHKFTNNKVWNATGMIRDSHRNQDNGTVNTQSDLAVQSYNSGSAMHQVRGILVEGNTLLDVDQTAGQRGPLAQALSLLGIDGGGAANYTVARGNTMRNANGACLLYGSVRPASGANLGGRIWGNTATNCGIGAYFFGSTIGGRLDHNIGNDGLGEGIQIGGPLTVSTPDVPQRIDHNQIANFGKAASSVGYNGLDCNGVGGSQVLVIDHNLFYNTNSAGVTFESSGCYGANFHDNVIDQYAYTYQPGATYHQTHLNSGSLVYVTHQGNVNGYTGANWHHNHWVPGANLHPFGGGMECQEFLASISDKNSTCHQGVPGRSVLGFRNEAAEDFSLTPDSPLRGRGTNGGDVGALPLGVADVRVAADRDAP